ncbi:hypothetical protein ACHAWF_007363 [Thalassiosira exigua]
MAPSKNNPLYNNDNPTINDVYKLGKEMMGRAGRPLGILSPGGPEDLRLRSFFGCGVLIILDAWFRMKTEGLIPEGGMFFHYLWTLMFLKIYGTENVMCGHAGGVDKKTWRNWVWKFVYALSSLEYTVIHILFEYRKKGDIGNDCLLSVDGTDYRLPWLNTNFWTYKFKSCGLRYEVGIGIIGGDICWLHGPFPPGLWNDNMIFQDALVSDLEEGERVEADDGYKHSAPEHVRCPGCIANAVEREEMQRRVRARHETCNKRLKQWGVLKQIYRHDVGDHGEVFRACAVLTQLSIQSGEPLFEVEYSD